jgi:hypothetical protein
MKNLKKVLALVLAFAMCLTMFASAATYTDVSSDSEYFNAVTLLSDLGIVTGYTDGTYGPDQTITRAEACALVARMLTGKTDVAEYQGASNFTDVAKSYWGESAIGYCVVNNIVVGDGDGKFRPDDAVTQAEFVTMVTRGLGYETASSPLTYPYGYISAAQDNDVLKDVTIVPSEPALRGMDAVIVYNAIFAEYPKMATYKYVNGVYTQDIPTVAEYVYHIVKLGEQIGEVKVGTTTYTLDEDTTFVVTGKSSSVEDVIGVEAILTNGNRYTGLVDLGTYDCSMTKSQIDAVKYYETKLYYSTEDKEIVAIEVLDSQSSYEINSQNYSDTATNKDTDGEVLIDGKKFQIQKYALNAVQYDEDNDTYLTALNMVDTDGKKNYTGLESILNNTKNGDVYTLYDWNGDRDIDWVDVSTRYYGYVSSYTEGKKISFVLDGHNGIRLLNARGDKDLNASIDLTDDSENYAWSIASDVKEGSIVEIDVSREYSTDVKDTFATYTVTPVTALSDVQFTAVSNSNTDDDKTGSEGDYYFDGTKYKVADFRIENTGDEDEETELWTAHQKKLGDNYNVYFDRNGYIVYLQAVNSKYDDYMLVLNTNDGNHGTNMSSGSPRVYALIDDDTYKTLTISDDVDTIDDVYNESYGFGVTTAAAGGTTTTTTYAGDAANFVGGDDSQDPQFSAIRGALVGYKLDSNGQIADMAYVGNAGYGYADADGALKASATRAAEQGLEAEGGASHSIIPGQVTSFDDDTYKIEINGTKYLLTDNTKVFLYKDAAIGTTGTTADNNSKVVTASELAEISSSDTSSATGAKPKYIVYATAITLSGAANASTIEAIALNVNDTYYTATSGTKYPALITDVNQAVVSGSSSKYDYTITAWVQGDKNTLKTAQMSNSDFKKNVLVGFDTPDELKHKFAWLTLNSDGQITKIEAVSEDGSAAGDEGSGVTATRAIIASKTGTSGLSFIPFVGDNANTTGWSVDTSAANTILAINTTEKTAMTDYAAYDKDVAFYTIDVRPNLAGLTQSVKKGPDGDYKVSAASATDVQVSTISNTTANNIYYVADLFFNNDGDIVGVFAYDQDVHKKSTDTTVVVPPSTTDLTKVGTKFGGKGTSGNPYTMTLTNGWTSCTLSEVMDLLEIEPAVIANDKEKLSGTGNLEVGKTLAQSNKDHGDLVPSTTMGFPSDASSAPSFDLYIKDEDGNYYTITVQYDFTDLEKVNYYVDVMQNADKNLDQAKKDLQQALENYDELYETDLFDTYKNLLAAAPSVATLKLYAAVSVPLPSKEQAAIDLQVAWTAYKDAVDLYNEALDNYLDATTNYDAANKDTASTSSKPAYETVAGAEEEIEIDDALKAAVEEEIKISSGDSIRITVTSTDEEGTVTTYSDGDTLTVGKEGVTITVTTSPAATIAVKNGDETVEEASVPAGTGDDDSESDDTTSDTTNTNEKSYLIELTDAVDSTVTITATATISSKKVTSTVTLNAVGDSTWKTEVETAAKAEVDGEGDDSLKTAVATAVSTYTADQGATTENWNALVDAVIAYNKGAKTFNNTYTSTVNYAALSDAGAVTYTASNTYKDDYLKKLDATLKFGDDSTLTTEEVNDITESDEKTLKISDVTADAAVALYVASDATSEGTEQTTADLSTGVAIKSTSKLTGKYLTVKVTKEGYETLTYKILVKAAPASED